jgi:hypothetical protein
MPQTPGHDPRPQLGDVNVDFGRGDFMLDQVSWREPVTNRFRFKQDKALGERLIKEAR